MNFPPLTPNEIQAAYIDMRNKGQNGVPRLGMPMISIEEWRDEQLKVYKEYLEQYPGCNHNA